MKKVVVVLLLMVFFYNSFSQKDFFSDSLFLQELSSFMKPTYDVHSESEQEYMRFAENWNNGKLEDDKEDIIYAANLLKKKKCVAYPHFYQYLSALNSLMQKNDMNYYRKWKENLDDIIETQRIKQIQEFLEFSNFLIKDSIIVHTPSIHWKITTTNYSIGKDEKTNNLKITFNSDFDLYCVNNHGVIIDTFVIKRTNGICYPIEKTFIGKHGKVTWEQSGLPPDKVFATFGDYKLDLSKSYFTVNKAFFTNNLLGFKNIEGELFVKLYQTKSKNVSPVFNSHDRIEIKNIFPDLDFKGYLNMKGNQFLGKGKETPATVVITETGQHRCLIESGDFRIEQDKSLYSGSADVKFLFNSQKDTIRHLNVVVKYVKTLDTLMYDPQWFKFSNTPSHFLILRRTNKSSNFSPFEDTYHQIGIYTDQALWEKGDSLLYFITTKGSNTNTAIFQSNGYFDENEFDYFSGKNIDNLNHLAVINKMHKQSPRITSVQYQKYLERHYNRQINIKTVESIFQKLSYAGFVRYDRKFRAIYPGPKIYRYLQNDARIRQKDKKFKDFDKLAIVSKIGASDYKVHNTGVNAILNLTNNNLTIKNVQPFKLTPSVMISTPEIVVQKNRQLSFSGRIISGLMGFNGNDFTYDYDKNEIDIPAPGSKVQMWVADTLNNRIDYKPLSTQISAVQGKLQVEAPDNKSTTLDSTKYPRVVTTEKAKIYYETFANKYGEENTEEFNEKFYFEADNFDIDSLNNISDSTLAFPGMMHTGLFEPLRVTITVKSDSKGNRSLGFTECTEDNPEIKDGMEFKSGKFFGCFELNDGGLFGNGYIRYKSSYVKSNQFAFMPDLVFGQVDTFKINEQSLINTSSPEDIPLVRGYDVDFEWKDVMKFNKTDNSSIIIYPDKLEIPGDLKGDLTYTQNKMTGSGRFEFSDADIVDTLFNFKAVEFSAQACDFFLKVEENTTFKTQNLNGVVNIDKKLGSFFSNQDTSRIVFEDNKYACIMDHFLWKIDEGIVNIGGVMPGQDSTHYATSLEDKKEKKKTNKDIKLFGTILVGLVDTLTFNAASTTYQLKKSLIVADDVKKIKIADAMIYPNDKVFIKKGGIIDTLRNKNFDFPYNIFSDTRKYNHLFTLEQSDIVIRNRFNYIAFSPKYYYKYKNQELIFDKIEVENAPKSMLRAKKVKYDELQSVGTSKFLSIDTLELSNDFEYSGNGDIKIYANSSFLEFEGYSRFDTTCNEEKVPISDFKVPPTFINPDSVSFQMSYIHDSRKAKVYSGLYWSLDRVKNKKTYDIKFPFVSKLKNANTINTENAKVWSIFTPDGTLGYNMKSGEYRIADTSMLYSQKADTLAGNMIAFNKNLCLIRAQGQFNLFMPWDISQQRDVKDVTGKFKGFYRNDFENISQVFQGTWKLDFNAPQVILDNIVENSIENQENIPTLGEEKLSVTRKNYNVFMGKENTDLLVDQILTDFDYKLPDSLKGTIVFSDIKMIFNKDSSALVSKGDIGVATINNKKVDRYIKGYVKYRLHAKTRMLIIVLEPAPNIIYAFKYRYISSGGALDVYCKTQNSDIDQYLSKLKSKDKKFKDYQWIDADLRTFKSFAKEYFKNKR